MKNTITTKPEEKTVENSEGLVVGKMYQKSTTIKLGGCTEIIWGAGEIKQEMLPIQNLPEGDFQVVLKKKSPGKVYIKNGHSIRCFILKIRKGKLFCDAGMEQAAIHWSDYEAAEKFWKSIIEKTFAE